MKEIDINQLNEEYLTPDKMLDNEELYLLKEKIMQLSQADRNILLLYIDLGSYSKVAKVLNCSATLIYQKNKSIREKLGIQKKEKK